MSYVDNKRATALNIKSERVREYIEFSGKFKKRFIELILVVNFKKYYETGVIDGKLEELVSRFGKQYKRNIVDKPIFISWNKGDDIEDRTVNLLNLKLGSGASEFLEYVIENTLSPLEGISSKNQEPATLPSANASKGIMPEPVPEPVNPEDDTIDEKTLRQFDDDDVDEDNLIPTDYISSKK